jgi:hypothetical protein
LSPILFIRDPELIKQVMVKDFSYCQVQYWNLNSFWLFVCAFMASFARILKQVLNCCIMSVHLFTSNSNLTVGLISMNVSMVNLHLTLSNDFEKQYVAAVLLCNRISWINILNWNTENQ